MVTQSDLVPSQRFLQDVAGGQSAGLEDSGRAFRSKLEANARPVVAARFGDLILFAFDCGTIQT